MRAIMRFIDLLPSRESVRLIELARNHTQRVAIAKSLECVMPKKGDDNMNNAYPVAALVLLLASTPFSALAQNVKITPLGSHDGELCANDRATLFEDPTGVRLLY